MQLIVEEVLNCDVATCVTHVSAVTLSLLYIQYNCNLIMFSLKGLEVHIEARQPFRGRPSV